MVIKLIWSIMSYGVERKRWDSEVTKQVFKMSAGSKKIYVGI